MFTACEAPGRLELAFTIAEVLSMSDPGNVAQLPCCASSANEDRRLHAGHLWIFSNEVDTGQSPLAKFKAGELVRVLAAQRPGFRIGLRQSAIVDCRANAGNLADSRCRLAGGAHSRGP